MYIFTYLVTQGLMDIALLSANANQLRHAMELCAPYRSLLITLFSLSIVCLVFRLLQLMVPAFSAAVFRSHLSQYNLQFWASDLEYLKLKQWDYFLLIHILNNLPELYDVVLDGMENMLICCQMKTRTS